MRASKQTTPTMMAIFALLLCIVPHALATRPFLPSSRPAAKTKAVTRSHRHLLIPRGGSVSSTPDDTPKPALDLVTWSRIRVKSDPSSIPITALLSKRYLDVPTNSNTNNLQPLGLTSEERLHRLLHVYGPNELEQPPERTLLSFIIEQFDDKLVRILLVVALASAFFGLLEVKEEIGTWGSGIVKTVSELMGISKLDNVKQSSSSIAAKVVEEAKAELGGEPVQIVEEAVVISFGMKQIIEALIEPIIISTILVINALVGGYQSLNASKGISALKQMQAQKAVVRIYNNNSGQSSLPGAMEEVEVDASSLVPGDIVVLSVGQKIPADVRLISVSTSTFTVDEACLTGESDSVPKIPYKGDVIEGDEEHSGHVIDDLDEIQENVGSMGKHANGMLYSGTVITAGKGVGVVVRTGMSTEMGKVSNLLLDICHFALRLLQLKELILSLMCLTLLTSIDPARCH